MTHPDETLAEGLLDDSQAPVKHEEAPFPPWWKAFFWNPYCEDWPQYGRRNCRDAEERLPTLKFAIQQNPQLLDGPRIPSLTVTEKFTTLKFLAVVAGLSAQIASLMSLSKQFSAGVESDEVKRFGKEKFAIATNILLYTPLVFALMIPFMYNTKRARDAFYFCFSKGYLLDFPESLAPSFFMSHRIGILYVAALLFYFVFGAGMFLAFEAPSTIWIIFLTNVSAGLGATWMNHFCLESNLISLSAFIETVDDRDQIAQQKGLPSRPVIDKYTLSKAADLLRELKPLRARAPYKEYTSVNVFRAVGGSKGRMAVRFGVFFCVAVLGAGMYGMFALTAQQEDMDKWTGTVTPCVQVCFDHNKRSVDQCFNCMCDCATSFGVAFNPAFCESWLNVPGCDNRLACNQTCGGEGGPA